MHHLILSNNLNCEKETIKRKFSIECSYNITTSYYMLTYENGYTLQMLQRTYTDNTETR